MTSSTIRGTCTEDLERAFTCREVTKGFETLSKFEGVETTKEGIFVMPKERITIHSTYVYCDKCEKEIAFFKHRIDSLSKEIEALRSARLPGN